MITNERIDEIFTQMSSLILELASDPNALGPQYFQDKISDCRNYLNQVSLVITELNRERLTLSTRARQLESAYELEYDELLANDEHVRRLANIEDRKSTVNYLLREKKKEITSLKDSLHSLDAVYKVVSHRNKELHATMNAIKDQRRLMQAEIQSGSFYGDERQGSIKTHGVSKPRGPLCIDDDIDGAQLDAILSGSPSTGDQGATAQPEVAPAPEPTPEPEPAVVTPAANPAESLGEDEEAKAAAEFLGEEEPAGDKPNIATEPSKDDLEALLESI